jgi:hypothetical protein
MKPQKFLPVIAVVILLYYVCRQVHIKHKHLENMEADKLLSQTEKRELQDYYASLLSKEPQDASKLSNKSKIVVNTITENPLSAVTDSVVAKLIFLIENKNPHPLPNEAKEQLTPARVKAMIVNGIVAGILLPLMFAYQDVYVKATKEPTRFEFESEIKKLIEQNPGIGMGMGLAQEIINISNGKGDDKNFLSGAAFLSPALVDLVGNTPVITVPNPSSGDKIHVIDLSGPIQRNIVDTLDAYFYPTPDFFTWIKKLIFR